MGMDLTREAIGFAAGLVSTAVIGGGAIYFFNGRRTGTRFLVAGDSYSQYQKGIEDAVRFDMYAGSNVRLFVEEAKKAVKKSDQVFGLKNENGKIVKGKDNDHVSYKDFEGLVRDNDKFKSYSEQEQKDVWGAYHDNVRKKLGELCGEAFY